MWWRTSGTTGSWPSTSKAILAQTAVDQTGTASGTNPDTGNATVYGPGPDWGTGYGSVDAQAAVGEHLALADTAAQRMATSAGELGDRVAALAAQLERAKPWRVRA